MVRWLLVLLLSLSTSPLARSRVFYNRDGSLNDEQGFLSLQSSVKQLKNGQFVMYPDVMADQLTTTSAPRPRPKPTNCIPRDSDEGVRRIQQQLLASAPEGSSNEETTTVAEGFDATGLPENYTEIEPPIGAPVHFKLCDY